MKLQNPPPPLHSGDSDDGVHLSAGLQGVAALTILSVAQQSHSFIHVHLQFDV